MRYAVLGAEFGLETWALSSPTAPQVACSWNGLRDDPRQRYSTNFYYYYFRHIFTKAAAFCSPVETAVAYHDDRVACGGRSLCNISIPPRVDLKATAACSMEQHTGQYWTCAASEKHGPVTVLDLSM
eukprot:IDg14021t1